MLVQKPFDQIIALSRASAKYRMGPAGLYVQDAINVPSLSYDPITGLPRGLLAEQASTNLLTQSSDVKNSPWTRPGLTVTDAGIGKITGLNAQNLVPDATNANHYIGRGAMVPANADTCMWAIAKPNGYKNLWLYGVNADNMGARFDLVAKTVTDYASGTAVVKTRGIIDVGGGWLLCYVGGQANFAGTSATYVSLIANDANVSTYSGDGTSGILVCHHQIESGLGPTSPIVTTAAQATRAADFATITDLTKLAYNQSEGALYAEFMIPRFASGITGDSGQGVVAISDAASTNYLMIGVASNGTLLFYRKSGASANTLSTANATTPFAVAKVAISYGGGQNDAICLNGGAVATAAAITPNNLTEMRIGRFAGNPAWTNGWLRNVLYFPKRKTVPEMQTLTT